MKPSVYVETTIIGYLAMRLSCDLIVAANQQLTRDWWDNDRPPIICTPQELLGIKHEF